MHMTLWQWPILLERLRVEVFPRLYMVQRNVVSQTMQIDVGHWIHQFGSHWKKSLKECKTVKSDINELWLGINTFIHWLSRQKRQHKFIGRQS